MTPERNIEKNLAGEQDFAYGESTVDQTRAGGAFTLDEIRSIWPINDVSELDTLNSTRHPKAMLIDADTLTATLYIWNIGTNMWDAVALGDTVEANDALQITVYKRQEPTPSNPVGGSYENPVPAGWSSSIPDGIDAVWSSTRIFTRFGTAPQEPDWSDVTKLTDPTKTDTTQISLNTTGTYTWGAAEASEQVVKTWSVVSDLAIRKMQVGETIIQGNGSFALHLRASQVNSSPLTWPVVATVFAAGTTATAGETMIFVPAYYTIPNGSLWYFAISIQKTNTTDVAIYQPQPLLVSVFKESPDIVW